MTFEIIGSGHAAWVLSQALLAQGHACSGVCARNSPAREELASILQVPGKDLWPPVSNFPGVVLLAVADSALPELAQKARQSFPNAFLVHLSGATPLDVLPGPRRGVAWPMASLIRGTQLNRSKTQTFWETERSEDASLLLRIAQSFGKHVHAMSSPGRIALHTSAALTNNFMTHLMEKARALCAVHQVPFSLLTPLLEQTLVAQIQHSAGNWQTGPAKRRDSATLQRHREAIGHDAALLKAYDALTESIQATYPV